MNEPSPTSKLRVELQKLNADNSLSKEEKQREMFMIMNMQNVPQQNQKCIASKSCSNIVAMNSAPPESSSPLLEQTIVEEGDDGKCKEQQEQGTSFILAYEYKLYCPHYPTRRVWIHHPEELLEFYPCRLCYQDEMERQYALDVSIYSNDSACFDLPKLDRYKVKYMKCRACLVSQKAMASCQNPDCYWFQVDHANYCDICHLWCNDCTKQMFHCDACGLCRVGNRNDYTHCTGCNLCIHKDADHQCIGSSDKGGTCPVCLEPLHDSQKPVVWSKCNHMFHGVCLETLLETSFRCPVCKKSVCDMDNQWNDVDQIMATESNDIPEEYKEWKWRIFCNDCQFVSIVQYNMREMQKCLRYTSDVARDAFQSEESSEDETKMKGNN